jgi:aspartate/methionine/tyrosine aminotransferase
MAFINALLAIADAGDEVILQSPYYFNHEMAVTMLGCRPVVVPTNERFQLDLDRIRAAVTPRTRAIVTVSPNNPTGAVYPETDLREVNELCRAAGVYHIHDEAYEYFTWDGAEHFSPGSIAGAGAHTISLYSLSKAYGFASWRIGYQVLPAHLIEAAKKVQDTNLICPPVISQFAATAALAAGREWCEPRLADIGRVRSIVARELEALGGICEVPPANGAFYFLLKLATGRPPMEVVDALIRRHGVAAIPGDAFGHGEGCAVRVSYGALTEANAREGMRRLAAGLGELCR